MNSSQIHLLTQINLADVVRQVECSAASACLCETDVYTSPFVHLTSVILSPGDGKGMRCQPIFIYHHRTAISLTSEGGLMFDLLESADL